MKIYISADIEGVAGVVSAQQCQAGNAEYERARRLMTQEVNVAVSGAIAAGATQVVVNDSHGGMVNIIAEELHADAELISGKPKPANMAAGLDDSFDAVFLTGHHGMASHDGVLAHTTNGRAFRHVCINGVQLGEPGLYGAYAGELGVPVTLISGDDCLREQNIAHFPDAEFAVVKYALGNRAARSYSPQKARQIIHDAAQRAVKQAKTARPFQLPAPFLITFEVFSPVLADQAMHLPPAKRIDAVTIGFECKSVREAIGWMSALSALASSVL